MRYRSEWCMVGNNAIPIWHDRMKPGETSIVGEMFCRTMRVTVHAPKKEAPWHRSHRKAIAVKRNEHR